MHRNRLVAWASAASGAALLLVLLSANLIGRSDRGAAARPTTAADALRALTTAVEPGTGAAADASRSALQAPGPETANLDSAFACRLDPTRVVDVGGSAHGLIEKVLVGPADFVESNQVVAELDSEVERAAVEIARLKTLLQDGASTDPETREWLRAREADLKRAVARLEARRIRTPITGVVVERRRGAGEVISGEHILRVAQIHPLRAEVVLPAALFGKVVPGMRAEIQASRTDVRPGEASGSDARAATVGSVDPEIDAESGTFRVELEVPRPEDARHVLSSGLLCQARFLPSAPAAAADTAAVTPRHTESTRSAKQAAQPGARTRSGSRAS